MSLNLRQTEFSDDPNIRARQQKEYIKKMVLKAFMEWQSKTRFDEWYEVCDICNDLIDYINDLTKERNNGESES